MTLEQALELSAVAWTGPNSHKVMDPELAKAFANILLTAVQGAYRAKRIVKGDRNFKAQLALCNEYGFYPDLTAEHCWNEGYRLGRRRWYWGPSWFVSLVGWLNTQRSKLKKETV